MSRNTINFRLFYGLIILHYLLFYLCKSDKIELKYVNIIYIISNDK